MQTFLDTAGTVLAFVIAAALMALVALITVSDCGPDGYGQQACIDRWNAAIVSTVTGR